ncbi:MAG TPA: ASPIC/UnbV domain-containing protein [Candidatus Cybelea sp.]|nr:ASPIC/UnbV domain-containing protein [Candidatus Cybelea sp.]
MPLPGEKRSSLIDKIELTWPSGIRQVLENVKADQILTVSDGRE